MMSHAANPIVTGSARRDDRDVAQTSLRVPRDRGQPFHGMMGRRSM